MLTDDSPYFGDAKIQSLQKMRDRQASELADVAGAVIHARTFSSDNPDQLGWGGLRDVMETEGAVTLRGVDHSTIERAREEFADFHPTLHYWDIFKAESATIRDVCGPIAQRSLPDGISRLEGVHTSFATAKAVQRFLSEQGISPFSTDALCGHLFPARLVVLTFADGQITATGFSAMTHNSWSPFAGAAWVGLIGVAPELRGIGLGKQVDAICNLAAVEELGATATIEFVAPDNIPSRAMLESCGLRQMEGLSVVMISTSPERMTR